MKVFAAYTSFESVVVDFSALRAGGFTPVLRDFHQCAMTPFHIYAFGGIKIDLPSDQLDDAARYMTYIQSQPCDDYDPIIPNSAKATGLTLLATICFFPGIIFLVSDLALLSVGKMPNEANVDLLAYSIMIFLSLSPILIGLHARYVAIPALWASKTVSGTR